MNDSNSADVPLNRCVPPNALQRWHDGWIDLETVAYDKDRRELRLNVEYISDSLAAGLAFRRDTVSAQVDQLLIGNVISVEMAVGEEKMLWLSEVCVNDSQRVVFRGSQGTLAVIGNELTCAIDTVVSKSQFRIVSLLGVKWISPVAT